MPSYWLPTPPAGPWVARSSASVAASWPSAAAFPPGPRPWHGVGSPPPSRPLTRYLTFSPFQGGKKTRHRPGQLPGQMPPLPPLSGPGFSTIGGHWGQSGGLTTILSVYGHSSSDGGAGYNGAWAWSLIVGVNLPRPTSDEEWP